MNARVEAHPSFDAFVFSAGKFFFRYRNGVFPLIFLTAAVLAIPSLAVSHPTIDGFLTASGLLVVLSGQCFRFLVIGLAYIERGGRRGEVYASSLVTTGFYSHSRNPMYLGNMLIAVGFIVALGSLTASVVLIPFFLFVYYSIVVAEEAYLESKFPAEYAQYKTKVPRFFPRTRGLGDTFLKFYFDWRRALRKEYGTLFGTLGGALFIIFLKTAYRNSPDAAFNALIHSQFPVWESYVFLAFLGTRLLKKTKVI